MKKSFNIYTDIEQHQRRLRTMCDICKECVCFHYLNRSDIKEARIHFPERSFTKYKITLIIEKQKD